MARTLHEIKQDCEQSIEKLGERAPVVYFMTGIEPAGTARELWKNGPTGHVSYQSDENRVVVMFSAKDVLTAIENEVNSIGELET